MGKSKVFCPAFSALFGKTRQALLSIFFLHPGQSYYFYEIIRIVGAGHGAVQRELKRLSEAGIIKSWRRGKLVFYQANPGCPIFAELKNLAVKTSGITEVIADSLISLKPGIQLAFIYGSYATGELRPESDIDLFVVGDLDPVELHRVVSRAEKKIARAINYVFMSSREFRRKQKEKAGFVAQVLAGPKIDIIKSKDEI